MAKCHQHGMVIDCLGIMCFYLVEMDDPSSKRNECARTVEGWMDGQPEKKAQTHQAFLRHEWSVVCSFRLTLGSARLNRFPFFAPISSCLAGLFLGARDDPGYAIGPVSHYFLLPNLPFAFVKWASVHGFSTISRALCLALSVAEKAALSFLRPVSPGSASVSFTSSDSRHRLCVATRTSISQ
jgi:hypothetical protein